jgi:hypothetical protein
MWYKFDGIAHRGRGAMVFFHAWVRWSGGLSATFILALGLAFPAFAQPNLTVTATATSSQRATSAAPEKRVALVIGNNAYRNGPLKAAINDARAMTSALTELGFRVVKLENVGRLAMVRAIRSFVDDLGGSQAVGLFYFAGHGVQLKGKNFLIPIDADIEDEDEIELQSVDLQYMLDKFADMRSGMNILILDACRNNPFARRGVKRASGLAEIDGPPGTLVAFAATPGHVAEEIGDNGIYTKNILANIRESGLPVEEVFKRVRRGVLAETHNRQNPWETTSLVRDFYFKGAPAGSGYKPATNDSEAEAWANVESSRNIYDFVAFMRRFPQGRYQSQILARINSILSKLKPAPPSIQPNELKEFLNEAYAGLQFRRLNKYSAEYYGLTEPKGVIVVEVERGSFAKRAGLLPGDIVIGVNGKPAIGVDELEVLGRTILPGEFVEAVVWRNRREVSVSGLAQRVPIEMLMGRIGTAQFKEKNYDRARAFYEYLAATDYAKGQAALGMLYLAGLGVQRDYKVAESWLLKAASQGMTDAAAFLSMIYLDPITGIKNDSEAFRWAKFSAEAGVPEGAVMLAEAHFDGVGTPKNDNEGVRWARIAAEQGQSRAMFFLGMAYEKGAGGVPRSLDDAKTWYRRARDLGIAPAKAALQRLGE